MHAEARTINMNATKLTVGDVLGDLVGLEVGEAYRTKRFEVSV